MGTHTASPDYIVAAVVGACDVPAAFHDLPELVRLSEVAKRPRVNKVTAS